MTRIALFASGNGTNAENLIRRLTKGQVVVLLCNNPQAPVLDRARRLGVPAEVFTAEQLQNPATEPPAVPTGQSNRTLAPLQIPTDQDTVPAGQTAQKARASAAATPAISAAPGVLSILRAYKVDLLVLAGFLWKIPEHLLQAYPGRILNIHPALLPAFGGKGMYGMHVHRAVLEHLRNRSASASNTATDGASADIALPGAITADEGSTSANATVTDTKSVPPSVNASQNTADGPVLAPILPYGVSGITIHLIDSCYDRGQMLFQATCPVDRDDTPESLAQKVHALEYKYFPHVVDHYIDTAPMRDKTL